MKYTVVGYKAVEITLPSDGVLDKLEREAGGVAYSLQTITIGQVEVNR